MAKRYNSLHEFSTDIPSVVGAINKGVFDC